MTTARAIRRLSRDSSGEKRPASDYYNIVVLAVLVALEVIGLLTAPKHGGSQDLWHAASKLPDRGSGEGVISVLLLVAVLLALQVARSIGPIAVTLPQAQWWLPLPLPRRGFVFPGWTRAVAGSVALSGLLTCLVLYSSRGLDHVGSTFAAATGAAGLGTGIVAVGMLLERFETAGRRVDSALRLAVPVAGLLLVASVIGGLPLEIPDWLPTGMIVSLSKGTLWPLAVLVPLGVIAAFSMYFGLPALTAAQLRRSGAGLSLLTSRVLSMGGATFEAAPERAGAHRRVLQRRRPPVSGPSRRFVITQLRVLIRWPGLMSRAVFFAALPAMVITIPYFDSRAVLIALLVLSTLRATSIAGSAAGVLDRTPQLARLFLLTPREQRRLSSVPSLVVLTPWCLLTFSLPVLLGAAPVLWLAMAIPVSFGLSGAAVRTGTRQDPEWATAAISTPMGAVPLGLLASAFHGRAASVVVILPALVALAEARVTPFGFIAQVVLGMVVWWWSTASR